MPSDDKNFDGSWLGYDIYADHGCSYAPSCLKCPFKVCRYDKHFDEMPHRNQQAKAAALIKRDTEIMALRQTGMWVEHIAEKMGISGRTVARVLARGGASSNAKDVAQGQKAGLGGKSHTHVDPDELLPDWNPCRIVEIQARPPLPPLFGNSKHVPSIASTDSVLPRSVFWGKACRRCRGGDVVVTWESLQCIQCGWLRYIPAKMRGITAMAENRRAV